MNATIETHWSRILYCDIFAAGAEMPHPSEIAEGGVRRPGGGSETSRKPVSARGRPTSHGRKER